MRTTIKLVRLTAVFSVAFLLTMRSLPARSERIDMAAVRELAKLPVAQILVDAPVPLIEIDRYWEAVRKRSKPLVVFFYSNQDGPSQRLATLIRYVAVEYAGRLDFARVQVVQNGKPGKELSESLRSTFSLDATPGVLFYDNVGDRMVLEDEDYIDPDFKEFRTPAMLLWSTYYRVVRSELDKLLSD